MAQAAITQARSLLQEPVERANPWGLLLAASMAALSAVLMAGVLVLGPGVNLKAEAVAPTPSAQFPHG